MTTAPPLRALVVLCFGGVTLAAADVAAAPSLTFDSPWALFSGASVGADLTVTVAVDDVPPGPEDYLVAWYLDGVLAATTEGTTHTFPALEMGQRHLFARLVGGADGAGLGPGTWDQRYVRVSGPCSSASDCDDGNTCSRDRCIGGTCRFGLIGGVNGSCCDSPLECPSPSYSCLDDACVECIDSGACDDSDPCTEDVCTAAGTCDHSALAGCCASDADCDDGDLCTDDTCDNGVCTAAPGMDPGCCNTDADCAPADPCVPYRCYRKTVGGQQVSSCRYGPPRAGCCGADADCDDGDPCTADGCDAGACTSTPVGSSCCRFHVDCDDGDPLTEDRCLQNTCEHTAHPDACVLPATSHVVIHELQLDPAPLAAEAGQWVELYNPHDDQIIDLTGWVLDIDGTSHVLTAVGATGTAAHGLKIYPKSRYVIANAASPDNGGFLPHYVAPLVLNPLGSSIVLLDAGTQVVDAVSYDASWPIVAGRSLELRHPHLDNQTPASWRAASDG